LGTLLLFLVRPRHRFLARSALAVLLHAHQLSSFHILADPFAFFFFLAIFDSLLQAASTSFRIFGACSPSFQSSVIESPSSSAPWVCSSSVSPSAAEAPASPHQRIVFEVERNLNETFSLPVGFGAAMFTSWISLTLAMPSWRSPVSNSFSLCSSAGAPLDSALTFQRVLLFFPSSRPCISCNKQPAGVLALAKLQRKQPQSR
jgi:hypothetical protein